MIGSEIYRHSRYGTKHPLSIPRVSTVIDLVHALGWVDGSSYIDSPVASREQLTRFHAPDYVDAIIRAEKTREVSPEERERYNIGRNGNPVFPEIFRRPATACGAGLLAADLLATSAPRPDGRAHIVHSVAGGTHHGQPDRASGFCFFNDPALAILAMQDRGLDRIAYVDLDAHHGDGVEDAFADDDRVLTVSIHEAGRWPHSGPTSERRGGHARNLAVPQELNDDEMALLIEQAVLPLVARHRPEALVIQGGADALADDPQSRLALSNNALWHAIRQMKGLAPRLLMLGGGGYNPWSVGRCWTGNWAVLTGREVPDRLPPAAETLLRSLHWNHSRGRNPPEHWFTTLADPPRGGPIRDEIRVIAKEVLAP